MSPTDEPRHPAGLIAVEDLLADPAFLGASISPDGTRLAYLAPAYGRTNVWVRGIDEAHEHPAVAVRDDPAGRAPHRRRR